MTKKERSILLFIGNNFGDMSKDLFKMADYLNQNNPNREQFEAHLFYCLQHRNMCSEGFRMLKPQLKQAIKEVNG